MSVDGGAARERRWWLALASVVAVGVALRLRLAGQSVFADELSTYWIVSTRDLGGVLSLVHSNAEITPPLSFAASWLTTQVQLSPEMLRAPSLVAGALTIPAVYAVGTRTVGRPAALLAAALTALSPFMAYYSAEARGYGLLMAFVVASTLALLLAVDDGRRRWWVLYGLATCAAMYTHYTGVFVLGAQLVWLLITHPEGRRPALLATGAAVLGYLPWVTGLQNDLTSPTTDILSSLQPFTADAVKTSLVHWAVAYPYSSVGARAVPGIPALAMLGAALVLAAGALAWRLRGAGEDLARGARDHRVALVVALAVAVPVGEAVASLISTNLLSTRNLAASWPALSLALAALLMSPGPRLRVATVSLALAAFGIGAAKLVLDADVQRPRYEAVADYVNRTADPGSVVIDESAEVSPGPLSHIDPLLAPRYRVLRSRQPQQDVRPFGVFDRKVPPAEAMRRAIRLSSGRRIFLVTDAPGALIPRPRDGYRVEHERRYEGLIDLVVRVYAKPAS